MEGCYLEVVLASLKLNLVHHIEVELVIQVLKDHASPVGINSIKLDITS
jgi:hypothetical protein